MKQEFNLSEKVYKIVGWEHYEEFFSRRDVKEFIILLKKDLIEQAGEEGLGSYMICKIIDKLAGDKLI